MISSIGLQSKIESMLLVVQLKNMINYHVRASKILEDLTAASCQETFCYERAELLGDAYLKWVVSRFLFLKYPHKHECQLTRMRQQMVDLALFGHVHNYERTCSVYPNKCKAMPIKDIKGVDTYDNKNYSAPIHAVIGMAGFTLDKSSNHKQCNV